MCQHLVLNIYNQRIIFYASSRAIQVVVCSIVPLLQHKSSLASSRRSVTGFCVTHSSLGSLRSKPRSREAQWRQNIAANSESSWLKQLLVDFSVTYSMPTVLYCDNQAGSVKLLPVRTEYHLANVFIKLLLAPVLAFLLTKMTLKHSYGNLVAKLPLSIV